MLRSLCLGFLLFIACAALAGPPEAGIYTYTTANNASKFEYWVSTRVALTQKADGSFAIRGFARVRVSQDADEQDYVFDGTLIDKERVVGQYLRLSDPPQPGNLRGTWNTSTNKLELDIVTQQFALSRVTVSNGRYVLTKTDYGSQPQRDRGWSGVMDAASLTETEVDPNSGNQLAMLKGTWDTPPAELLPGQTYHLFGTATASFAPLYHPSVGMTVRWEVNGDVTAITLQKAYAGYASTGQLSTESSASCGFTVGKGGNGNQIVIANRSGGNLGRSPATYTYTWKPGRQ